MEFAVNLIFALGLDLMLGDPEWFHHPVRIIGALISWLEKTARKIFPNERLAGTITGLLTVLISTMAVYATIRIAYFAEPVLGRIFEIAWLYLGISSRSLSDSALNIYDALIRGDISGARESLSRIVGRDTDRLDNSGISRGAIESVSENTVDGIMTPVFFAFVGSFFPFFAAPMMWAFKAMSTCDSMIGHKDEKYLRFGTFSARLDDVANFIPARLCYIFFPLASLILGYSPLKSLGIALRDSRHHDSPNAGIPEAAVAGALETRLGGTVHYDGIPHEKKPFGHEFPPPAELHIMRSVRLMWAVTALMIISVVLMKILLDADMMSKR